VQVARHARFRAVGLKVRIAPAASADQAAQAASRLRTRRRARPKGARRPRTG
jgi:hypothetical protein